MRPGALGIAKDQNLKPPYAIRLEQLCSHETLGNYYPYFSGSFPDECQIVAPTLHVLAECAAPSERSSGTLTRVSEQFFLAGG
jgi:hypothetical protein